MNYFFVRYPLWIPAKIWIVTSTIHLSCSLRLKFLLRVSTFTNWFLKLFLIRCNLDLFHSLCSDITGNFRPPIDEESLLFHTLRDSNVIIINDGKTAHRPK